MRQTSSSRLPQTYFFTHSQLFSPWVNHLQIQKSTFSSYCQRTTRGGATGFIISINKKRKIKQSFWKQSTRRRMLVASFAKHSYSPFVIVSHTIYSPSPNIFGVNKRAIGLPPKFGLSQGNTREHFFFFICLYFSTPPFVTFNSNPIE